MLQTKPKPLLPAIGLLRWEIAGALMIKILLLTALWFLIFHWQEHPTSKPAMSDHFSKQPVKNSHIPTELA